MQKYIGVSYASARHAVEAIALMTETDRSHLKQGPKIIRSGITNDLERREREHPRVLGEDVHLSRWDIGQHCES